MSKPNVHINEAAVEKLYEQIGNQVRDIVNTTVHDTLDDDLETATETLHERLNVVDNLNFDRGWARNAIETLRRGEELRIEIR